MAKNEFPSDIEIAQNAQLKPMVKSRRRRDSKTTIRMSRSPYRQAHAREVPGVFKCGSGKGKLILVTAMSPTPAGEGKTTTAVGLADALVANGEDTMLCLREPSLGPCFA